VPCGYQRLDLQSHGTRCESAPALQETRLAQDKQRTMKRTQSDGYYHGSLLLVLFSLASAGPTRGLAPSCLLFQGL
jgi:hypothetical protein